MPSLPSELVFDILSRLPGKSLIRFRCVSKEFNSLISSHQFLRLHYRRSLNSLFTLHAVSYPQFFHRFLEFGFHLYLTDDKNVLQSKFFRKFDCTNLRIYPSYHQLLCFSCGGRIFLCDPNRHKLLELPSNIIDFPISFGFVSSTMQYKVIRWLWRSEHSIHSNILTVSIAADGRLEISPWRSLESYCSYLLESPSVHVDGDLFWKTTDFQIVLFSLQDEKFSLLQSSPPCFDLDKNNHLFELVGIRQNLHVIDYSVPKRAMEIWVLSDRKSCRWTRIHRIEIGQTPGFWPGRVCSVFPFRVLDIRSEQVLFQLLHPSRLKCYFAKTNSVVDHGEEVNELQLCHYTDGLLSLDSVVFR